VVLVDLVSYAQAVTKIFKEVGCSLLASTLECLKLQDARQEYHDKQYHKDIKNKWRHGAGKQEIIKVLLGHKKANAKAGISYKSGMALKETSVEP